MIRRYPTHYHWSYKRYKAHPDLRGVYHKPVQEALADVQAVRAQTQNQTNAATTISAADTAV